MVNQYPNKIDLWGIWQATRHCGWERSLVVGTENLWGWSSHGRSLALYSQSIGEAAGNTFCFGRRPENHPTSRSTTECAVLFDSRQKLIHERFSCTNNHFYPFFSICARQSFVNEKWLWDWCEKWVANSVIGAFKRNFRWFRTDRGISSLTC